jgi:cytochrome bd ubiquinol oxidase subunit II
MMSDALLPVIWAGLMAFAVLAYVVLDGFDLGIGILFAVEREREERGVLVNSVAPVWDGNETWLVLGGGGLFAVFPLAYGLVLPALYPTIIAMLLALIFRGVAFEFRFRAESVRGREFWDMAFFLGSTTAAFAQGLTLGGLLQGIHEQGGVYAGGWWDWLSPFTVLCGVAVVTGYALLGSCYLIWRTDGALQSRARHYAVILGVVVGALTLIASVWSPFLHPQFWHRWFAWPNILLTSPVPLLLLALAYSFNVGLARLHHFTPFLCAVLWFVLCFAGLGISFWPLMVPPDISIWQAAAPPETQRFLLRGTVFLIPLILAYNAYAYWVFRGKVGTETHYH